MMDWIGIVVGVLVVLRPADKEVYGV